MYFNILTPSFNQSVYLLRCVASVWNQVGSQSGTVDRCSLLADSRALKERPADIGLLVGKMFLSVFSYFKSGGSACLVVCPAFTLVVYTGLDEDDLF